MSDHEHKNYATKSDLYFGLAIVLILMSGAYDNFNAGLLLIFGGILCVFTAIRQKQK